MRHVGGLAADVVATMLLKISGLANPTFDSDGLTLSPKHVADLAVRAQHHPLVTMLHGIPAKIVQAAGIISTGASSVHLDNLYAKVSKSLLG